jgi:O-antigen ligase
MTKEKFVESKSINNICLFLLFIMFCGTFAHSTINYVRLIPELLLIFILILRFLICIKHNEIKRYKNPFKYILWYLTFTLFNILSLKWTISVQYSKDLISSLWFCFTLLLVLSVFITDAQKLNNVIKVIIWAIIYMCIVILLSDFSLRGTDAFGSVTGLYFNRIALLLDYGIFLCFYIFKKENKRKYLLAIPFFFLVIYFTGSRKSLLMPFAFFAIFMVLNMGKDIKKIIKYFFGMLILFAIMFLIIISNSTLEKRMTDLFSSVVNGANTTDASIVERAYYRNVAFSLFKESPIKGQGANSFRAYLNSINYKHVTYSHCNYLELLATIGIIGFILFYAMYFLILWNGIKNFKKKNLEKVFVIAFIITQVIFEYGFVSFYFFELQFMITIVYYISCFSNDWRKIEYENSNTYYIS